LRGLINRMTAEKLEADRAEIARQQAEIDAKRIEQEKEAQRLEDEKKAREREEIARQEERDRIAKEQAEKEAREKEEAERKEREERERLEREKKKKEDNRCNQLVALGYTYTPETNFYKHEDFQEIVTFEEIVDLPDGEWAVTIEKIKNKIDARNEERAEAERKAKLEADQRYQAWLTEIGYDPEQFILSETTMGHVVAYKIVATFKK
jgi:hypothetical protein